MDVIEIIYIKAGGGHLTTSLAIGECLIKQDPNVCIKYTNLRVILDKVDPVKKYLRVQVEDFYNFITKHGITYGSKYMLKLTQFIIKKNWEVILKTLNEHFKSNKIDLIISTIPNFNELIHEASSKLPLIVVMCDFADLPPHFWLEDIDAYYLCPTQKSIEQARKIGLLDNRIYPINGVVLREEFYHQKVQSNYVSNRPVGVVSFGGYGSKSMLNLAWKCHLTSPPIDFIYLTGNNAKLYYDLSSITRSTDKVFTYQSNLVPLLLNADFFIGKPGPGSISEALACGLPVLLEENSRTLVQEKYNLEWVKVNKVGDTISNLSDVDKIENFVGQLPIYQHNITNSNLSKNNALEKVTDLVWSLL